MENDLPVALVFLDTSIYVSNNFNYASPLFKALKTRIDKGQVRLGITEITISEIESRIYKGISEANQAFEKAKSKAKILRNSNNSVLRSIFQEWAPEEIEQELICQFKKYLDDFQVDTFGYDDVDVENVFSLYFHKKAPFGDSKKKSEFPDAFALKILEDWAVSEDSVVYIVSKDGDMEKGVVNFKLLEHVPSLPDLLSYLSFKFDELAPLCLKAYEFARKEIDQKLQTEFTDKGFYIDDQQGDVNDIFDVDIEEYTPSLLFLDYDEQKNKVFCEYQVITHIIFKADITYDDLSTASYDSEDKVLIPWDIISETVSSSEIVMSNIKFNFTKDDLTEYEVVNIDSDLADSIHVSSSENEDWPYK